MADKKKKAKRPGQPKPFSKSLAGKLAKVKRASGGLSLTSAEIDSVKKGKGSNKAKSIKQNRPKKKK